MPMEHLRRFLVVGFTLLRRPGRVVAPVAVEQIAPRCPATTRITLCWSGSGGRRPAVLASGDQLSADFASARLSAPRTKRVLVAR